jgi:PTS system nitrogen regulatory IIA component
MRNFSDDIYLDLILPHMKAISRKQALQVLAREASPLCNLAEEEILKHLLENAAHGRSGIGEGVAIPHARFENLAKPCIILARLDKAIEYDALDGAPVDIICAILSPESDGPLNLQRLALITRVLRGITLCQRLREAGSTDAIRAALLESDALTKAA